MKYYAVIAAVMFLAIEPVFAKDENGVYTILGHGSLSCGSFVEDYLENKINKTINSVWVSGYLTAINRYLYNGKNIAKGTDLAARLLWIHNYCHKNPLDDLDSATEKLYHALLNR